MDRHQSEAVSVFEAEQLLLVPDEGQWPLESLELFGIQVKGLQVGRGKGPTPILLICLPSPMHHMNELNFTLL